MSHASGLQVTEQIAALQLDWSITGSGTYYTEIWASETDDRSTAVMVSLVDESISTFYHIVAPGVTNYYWIRSNEVGTEFEDDTEWFPDDSMDGVSGTSIDFGTVFASGLEAQSVPGGIKLQWSVPTTDNYGNPTAYYSEVWVADENDRSTAVLLATLTTPTEYFHAVTPGLVKYYWVRANPMWLKFADDSQWNPPDATPSSGDTGELVPASNDTLDGGSNGDWSNLGNVTARDATFATATVASHAIDYAYWYDYGFSESSLPADANIVGIEVIFKGKSSSASDIFALALNWTGSRFHTGVTQVVSTDGVIAAPLTTTNTEYTFGSPTDLTQWGQLTDQVAVTRDIQYLDIISNDFGVAMLGDPTVNGITFSVDYLGIKVYYTTGGKYATGGYVTPADTASDVVVDGAVSAGTSSSTGNISSYGTFEEFASVSFDPPSHGYVQVTYNGYITISSVSLGGAETGTVIAQARLEDDTLSEDVPGGTQTFYLANLHNTTVDRQEPLWNFNETFWSGFQGQLDASHSYIIHFEYKKTRSSSGTYTVAVGHNNVGSISSGSF